MTGFASGDIALAICDRCRRKRPYTVMVSDPNFHGLRVCGDATGNSACFDQLDPYRLPPRQTEPITMRFPRPDSSVANTTIYPVTDDGALFETEDGAWIVISPGT